jgi:hypothetical protein
MVVVVGLVKDDRDDDEKAWTRATPPARSFATRSATKATASPTT